MLNISTKSILKKTLNISFMKFYHNEATQKFKILQIPGLEHTPYQRRQPFKLKTLRPRYFDMKGDEDWINMWPAVKSFNYSTVPLPIRQGHIKNSSENKGVIPHKYANSELIKIPNFLHLTPLHISKHCNVLKKYCTKWLDSLDDMTARHHLPLEFTQIDYIHSAPSIRDERARLVTLKVEIKHFKFDERERFKFIKLIGPSRYDKETDTFIMTADRCPTNQQNYDYIIYVLTALTKESKKFEQWEVEAEESDWLLYKWEKSQFKENVNSFIEKAKLSLESVNKNEEAEKLLKTSIEKLYNEGDNSDVMKQYKEGVLKLLQLDKNFSVETHV